MWASVLMLGVGALLFGAAFAHGQARSAGTASREGGTFRIAFATFDAIDPQLGGFGYGYQLLNATCAQLMRYPDKPPPVGFRVVPEVAARYPNVSRNGRTYTFTIRRGFHFSNGAVLTAQSFVRAVARAFAPSMQSPGAFLLEDVVGAKTVTEGEAPSGVDARRNLLVIKLTKPVPDLPARMTSPLFCAVPPNLPIDAEGAPAPLHMAGPYYVAEYVPGRRIVLKRNRFYHGTRPHHVDRFVVDLQAPSSQDVIDRIKAGRTDWGFEPDQIYFDQADGLARRYRSQFFVRPSLALYGFYLNSKRPLFRNNGRLRQAINFAVDRPALVREFGGPRSGVPTDQYLPPSLPGFADAHIYPLRGPKIRKARALARGHLRSRKAVLYIRDDPIYIAQAQTVKQNLAAIGIKVELKIWPGSLYYQKLYARGEPWDIGQVGWVLDYVDPYSYLNSLFAAGSSANPSFDSPKYNRLLAMAARLHGAARYRAYGALDVQLARDAAPFLAAFYGNAPTFVSKRVGCIVLRPYLDLAAACLKR